MGASAQKGAGVMFLTTDHAKAFSGIPVLVVNRVGYLPDEVIPNFQTMAWKIVAQNGENFREVDQWFMARKFVEVGRSRQVSEPDNRPTGRSRRAAGAGNGGVT